MPFIGRLAFRLFRKKPIQSSTQTSLAASGAVPDSGFVFVHNLQGPSAALYEFSGAVSAALKYIDLKELADATFKYAAAVYKADPKVADDIDSRLVLTCLIGVHRKPETAGIRFSELEYVNPSPGGSSKAIRVWVAESEVAVLTKPNFIALIVAVRGTERFVDHIVNANSSSIAAADFFVGFSTFTPSIRFLLDDSKGFRKDQFLNTLAEELSAHSGFLSIARTLSPPVLRYISKLNQESRIKRIIFTGHSAGGGVAVLLYLKFSPEIDPPYEDLKFSCFTFGAPLVLISDITELIKTEPSLERNRGTNLAFVNEFGMVCRVDQSYSRSSIDLFRSVYGLKPVMNDEIARKEEKPGTPRTEDNQYMLQPLGFQNMDPKAAVSPTEDRPWPLPKAEYHVFGDLVLLRKEQSIHVKPEE